MKPRRTLLSLGLAALLVCPATAGTDDQKKEEVVAKAATQDGFRFCNLSGQPVEVAKATYSAKRVASEAFVAEGWYQFEPGQCQVLWPGKLQYRYYLVYAQNKQSGPRGETFAIGSDLHSVLLPTAHFGDDYRPGAVGPEMPATLVGPRCLRVDARARDVDERQLVARGERSGDAFTGGDALVDQRLGQRAG